MPDGPGRSITRCRSVTHAWTISARPTSPASQVGPCGPDEATAVRAALAQLAPDSKTGRPWNSTPEDSNYDPCADLSAVLVTVQDATNSSPDQALMFHRGTFVGTATPRAYPFTKFDRSGIHKRHRGAELSDTSKL